MNISEILSKLNEEQLKPVVDTEGAVLVIAGAGSGKTRVLVSRILYLIMEKHVNPTSIMAITFTNKAADEMKERLSANNIDISYMWVSTIHSMCVKILRRDIDKLGYTSNFTIYDETDKDKVLKRILEELGFDIDKYLKMAKNIISTAKNDCLTPDEYKKEYADFKAVNEIYSIYLKYEDTLARSNCLDFDDLLFKTYTLFTKYPEIAEKYSNQFRYIHIDEFQDTNKVQFSICQMLAKAHGNIFVVGDDDQSIYSWRGAKIENILSFDEIYRGAKVYKLEKNYRSTKKILSLANCIIKNNTERREKELYTDNQDGAKIETFTGIDENAEASYIAMEIKSLMGRYQYKYSDFAVFMRINALSRAFEQELNKYAIPFKVYGGYRFFERKEIKDTLAYLKIINNTNDDESFLRSISVPKRGIGEKTLRDLMEFSSSLGISLFDAIDRLNESEISSGAKNKITIFKNLLIELKKFSTTNSVDLLIKKVYDDTGFLQQFEEKTEENYQRKMNLSELIHSAQEFFKDNSDATLQSYLESVTLSSDTDDINSTNAVTLATIHAVKGLEYPVVFVAGLDEKILPVSRMGDEDIEEERRLMYVAVTRAKERLYLTRASSRFLYGNRERTVKSRFLNEAQPVLSPNTYNITNENRDYYDSHNDRYNSTFNKNTYKTNGDSYFEDDFCSTSNNGGYSSNYAKSLLNNDRPKQVNNALSSSYKSGVKVKHQKFGEGIVISVSGTPDNIMVTVQFKGVGIKTLSVKYAPMEIL